MFRVALCLEMFLLSALAVYFCRLPLFLLTGFNSWHSFVVIGPMLTLSVKERKPHYIQVPPAQFEKAKPSKKTFDLDKFGIWREV